jgi:hypothetical protein
MQYLLTLSMAAVLAATVAVGCSGKSAAPATAARPDISGMWLFTPGGGLRPSQGDIPLTPWALERMKAERPAQGPNQNFEDTTDPSLRYADPNGYPRISMHPMKFKLIQTEDYVYQLWEYNQNWREIALNRPHSPDAGLTWYGEAVGKWEGDTLVVDSVGYKDSTWLDSVGHPHTEDLHIVERIHRVDGETLVFDFTFEDLKAYTKPWSSQLTFKLVRDGVMTENIQTISDELRFRERFLHQPSPIPIRR